MELNRREFLKFGGAGMGALVLLKGAGSLKEGSSAIKPVPLRKKVGETTTICPYDGSGCGFIVAADAEKVINIEGDPEHPINRGGGCAKGAAISQLRTVDGKDNPRRLTNVLYRKPGGTEWETKDWDWAIDKIAENIKATRDANFTTTDEMGYTVNRTDAIASVGGSALDNEECYLLVKMLRALGMVYIEHHARI
ncbi:MAG: dehydrogenase [Dehalococcoidales bacterium]|nr:MAG: dehydrogenase [Dehalococcoidales bacterium]